MSDTHVDYTRASRDLLRYLPLKLLTFAWFIAAFGAGLYVVAAVWSDWWPFDRLAIQDMDSARVAIFSVDAGFLGAAVYSFRGFYWAIGPQSSTNPRYQFDPNWTLWYVARPIMGGILGAFTFALLRAGALTLGAQDGGSSDVAAPSYFAVAFLGGFAVTDVLNWITVRARRTFNTAEVPSSGSPRHDAPVGSPGAAVEPGATQELGEE